jgi:hypothetical protein
MKEEMGPSDALDPEIARIYAGPLDAFVTGRNALVKSLRSAGRRADAELVKALRKPSRVAWALNTASLTESARIDRVEAAVVAAVAAQTGGGDFRVALADLRVAVQDLAAVAFRAAANAGYSLDVPELVHAVMAIVGSRTAFDMLRAGRLVDIPEAGGLDFLANATLEPAVASTESATPRVEHPTPDPAAVEALQRAEAAVTSTRDRLVSAEQRLRAEELNTAEAERLLNVTQNEALARRADRDRAQAEVESVAAQLVDAEKAAEIARSVARPTGS